MLYVCCPLFAFLQVECFGKVESGSGCEMQGLFSNCSGLAGLSVWSKQHSQVMSFQCIFLAAELFFSAV